MCVVRDKGEAGGMFALKKLVLKEGASRDGFPPTALREIKLLKECKHENIVRLHEIVINKKGKRRNGSEQGGCRLQKVKKLNEWSEGRVKKLSSAERVKQRNGRADGRTDGWLRECICCV